MKKTLLLSLLAFNFYFLSAQPLSVTVVTTNESCVPGNDGTATATVSGGSSPYTYLWSDFSTQPTKSNLTAGNYFVTVTDALGSSQVSMGIVSSPPPVNVNQLITPPSCPGFSDGSITTSISSGTPPFTYIWSGGLAGANPTNLSSGAYSLTLIDGLGCSGTGIIIVPDPAPIDDSVNQNGLILTAMQSNASYQWLDYTNGISSIPGANAQSFNAPINGIYAVEITLNSCVDTSQTVSTLTIGLEDNRSEPFSFTVFPNPTKGNLILEGENIKGERLRVYDLRGKVIYEAVLGNNKRSLDLHHLAKGIYFLELNEVRKKIVKIE